MKLIDLLQALASDTLVGIWNIDDKRAKCPTPQAYQKAGNIPWRKIHNIVYFDVMSICVVEKNGGLLIRVYSKERLNRSLDNYDLARKIKEAVSNGV